MSIIVDRPIVMLVVSFAIQWLAAWAGDSLRRTRRPGEADEACIVSAIRAPPPRQGRAASRPARRILFYELRDGDRLRAANAEIAKFQTRLWSAITPSVKENQNPVTALVASGMNDVLNSQGYTQAAWWNRIPPGAWLLLELVAVACNVLFGYSERRHNRVPLLVLPLIVAVSLFLIADIDSPRGGLIRVMPQNLIALAGSLGGS